MSLIDLKVFLLKNIIFWKIKRLVYRYKKDIIFDNSLDHIQDYNHTEHCIPGKFVFVRKTKDRRSSYYVNSYQIPCDIGLKIFLFLEQMKRDLQTKLNNKKNIEIDYEMLRDIDKNL